MVMRAVKWSMLLWVATPTIHAQSDSAMHRLDETVVSGNLRAVTKSSSPVPIEVYSRTFFRANPAPSIYEAMQTVNGVRSQVNCNVCNTGDIHINGMEGPYTMVMIDGMPIVSGLSTVYGLMGIPQSLIERVEIIKAPASTLFGSEAVGGVINVITKSPYTSPTMAADYMVTSWRERNLDIAATMGKGKLRGLVGMNVFDYDQPVDYNQDGFTDIALSSRLSAFSKWVWTRPEGRVADIAGRWFQESRWGGQMNFAPEFRGGDSVYGEAIDTRRWELIGKYQLPTRQDQFIQFSMNGHEQLSDYGNTSYNATQIIQFLQWYGMADVGKHALTYGAAYRHTYYDDNTPATMTDEGNAPAVIPLPGAFVQDEIQWDDQNTLLLGMRLDINPIHGQVWTPRLNYKWQSADRVWTARLSAGSGYRVANVFTEDHAALTGARTVVFTEELAPEQSRNININLQRDWFTEDGGALNLDITAFYTYFDNRIVPDYETNPNQIIYSNLNGHAVSQGVSLNLRAALPNGWDGMAGVTAMDVYIEEDGVRSRQLLTEQFSGVWRCSYQGDLWRLDYTGSVIGPMLLPLLGALDERDPESPWYSIMNIQVSRPLGNRSHIYAGVKNLLNFTPPANSIARAFDPFDRHVTFAADGSVVPTPGNPQALTFDPSYVYAPNQGIRAFVGWKYRVD